jgi:hypothetical protein
MIRASDYFVLSKINFHFCSTYITSSVEIDIEIDEVRRLEDVVGTKHPSYLNSCLGKTL